MCALSKSAHFYMVPATMSPKLLYIYSLLLLVALSSACGSNSDTETGPPEPVVAVQVTKAVRGDIA
ncbi:MAG: hypothetical protein GY868_12280, partial [Deltaproteobacteria bacterium]|nr:hypothetical protein [Deltaproteobacteria bacterium]